MAGLAELVSLRTGRGPLDVWRPGKGPYPFRIGQRFYHGGPRGLFRTLRPPAFVSPSRREAQRFAQHFDKNRVLVYELKALPTLVDFRDQSRLWRKADARRRKDPDYRLYKDPAWVDLRDRSRRQRLTLYRAVGYDARKKSGANIPASKMLCKSGLPVDGWMAYYPNEMLLCNPRKFLKYVGQLRGGRK